MSQRSNKLLDRVWDAIQRKHYSYHTERRYVEWIRQFILFHNKRHPSKMGAPELGAFLTHLALERKAAVMQIQSYGN